MDEEFLTLILIVLVPISYGLFKSYRECANKLDSIKDRCDNTLKTLNNYTKLNDKENLKDLIDTYIINEFETIKSITHHI